MGFDRSVRDGARERHGSAARATLPGVVPGVASVLRLQRSLGNRGVGQILARDTPEAGATDPTEVALSPQEMWDRVLAERGMASRVPPHRVAVTEEDLQKAKQGMEQAQHDVQKAGENPDLQITARKGKQAERREAAEFRLKQTQEALEAANRDLGKAQRAARSAQANRSEPVPQSPEEVNEQQLGHGVSTYAAVQVTDGTGKRVAFGIGAFDGKQHAEEMALRQIREELTRKGIRPGQHGPTGWKVTVVVDQHVCDERCRPALRQFADEYGVSRDEVRAYYPERVGADPKVSPKTASKTAHAQETQISSEGEQVIATGDHPYRLKAPPEPPPKTSEAAPKAPGGGSSGPPPGKASTRPPSPREAERVATKGPKSTVHEEHVTAPKGAGASAKLTAELEAAGKELSAFRRIGGKVTNGLATVVKLGVVPAQIALELLNAVQAIEMTESALQGEGWILTAQVRQAKDLARDTTQMVSAYDDGRYHADVERLVQTALKNDDHFAEIGGTPEYWSSLELSKFCVEAKAQLRPHVDQCQAIDDDMTWMMERVRAGQKFCTDMLNSDAVLAAEAAGAASGIPVGLTETLYEASLDLDKIAGYLGPAMIDMHKHLERANADLKLLDDNILTSGLAGLQDG